MTTNVRKQKTITAIFWSVMAVLLLAMGIYAIRDLPMRLGMKVSPSLYLAIEVSTDNTNFVTVFKNYGQETLGENVSRTIKNGNEIFLTGSVFNNIYSDEPIYIRITNYTQSSDVNDIVNYANGPALNAYFTAENGVTNYPSYGLENIAPYNGTNNPSAKTFVVVPQTVIMDSKYEFNLKLELSNFVGTEYSVTQNLASGITSLNNFATTTAIPGHNFETKLSTSEVGKTPIITQIAINSGDNQRNLTTADYNYNANTGDLLISGSCIDGNISITAVNSILNYNLVLALDYNTVAYFNNAIYEPLSTNYILNLSTSKTMTLTLKSELLPSSYVYKVVLKNSSNANVAYTETCNFTNNYLTSIIQVPSSNITSNLTMTITALPWDGVYPSIAGKSINQIKAMFAGGEGTVASPYLISNSRQLALLSSIRTETTTFNKAGVEYKQTNDIYLNDEYMSGDEKNPTPTDNGTPSRPVANANGMYMWNSSIYNFKGNYNGNFYVVSGLYYVGGSWGIGLFAICYGNITKTITVNGYLECTKESGDAYYSGIIGGNLMGNGSTITKCASYITIIQPNCSGCSGIVGVNGSSNQVISNCYFAGYIYAYSFTGGIVGYTESLYGTAVNYSNNYSCGKIVTNNTYCVGAVIGCYNPNQVTTLGYNCHLSGTSITNGARSYSGTVISEDDLKLLAGTLNTNAGEQIWQNAPGLNNGYPTFIKNRT